MYLVRFHFIDGGELKTKVLSLKKYNRNRIPDNTAFVTVENEDSEPQFIFCLKGMANVEESELIHQTKSILIHGQGWVSCISYVDAGVYIVSNEEMTGTMNIIYNKQKTSIWRVKKMISKYAERKNFICDDYKNANL